MHSDLNQYFKLPLHTPPPLKGGTLERLNTYLLKIFSSLIFNTLLSWNCQPFKSPPSIFVSSSLRLFRITASLPTHSVNLYSNYSPNSFTCKNFQSFGSSFVGNIPSFPFSEQTLGNKICLDKEIVASERRAHYTTEFIQGKHRTHSNIAT